jgi:hypothetical protein
VALDVPEADGSGVQVAEQGFDDLGGGGHGIDTSSTSKSKVALGGIGPPGVPRAP